MRIEDLPEAARVQIALDSNRKAVAPGMPAKFYVDITNDTGNDLDISNVKIELTASPQHDPSTIALRKTWTYRWPRAVRLAPTKRITMPIRPEARKSFNQQLGQAVVVSEFPLTQLAAGNYEIRAIVMDTFISPPYVLRVARPDLERARAPRKR